MCLQSVLQNLTQVRKTGSVSSASKLCHPHGEVALQVNPVCLLTEYSSFHWTQYQSRVLLRCCRWKKSSADGNSSNMKVEWKSDLHLVRREADGEPLSHDSVITEILDDQNCRLLRCCLEACQLIALFIFLSLSHLELLSRWVLPHWLITWITSRRCVPLFLSLARRFAIY